MKKRGLLLINRLFVILSVIVISFLLVSCTNKTPVNENDAVANAKIVQTGTQGVEISLMTNNPPSLIYDQNELVALLEIYNKGNHDLYPQDCFIQVTGFDSNIIKGGFDFPRSCAENADVLDGKSMFNTKGGMNTLEFHSSNIQLPTGVFEYNPTLNFVTCYNYHTIANPQICVDPLFYQVTAEQKNCQPKSVSLGGGQGGPVGVSYVGVNMIGSEAVFEINVQNYGTGRVLSPYTDLRSCARDTLEYTDLDKVAYNVDLTGGSLINCNPKDRYVKLTNNQGKIVCKFNIAGTSAFETILNVELDYNYIQSFTKSLKIIKTPE